MTEDQARLRALLVNARSIAHDQAVHGGKCGPSVSRLIVALCNELEALLVHPVVPAEEAHNPCLEYVRCGCGASAMPEDHCRCGASKAWHAEPVQSRGPVA